jgi:hypothetical protein
VQYFPGNSEYNEHDIGDDGFDYDDSPLPGSRAWRGNKTVGSGFLTKTVFNPSTFNIPCNTRMAYTVTFIVGVDSLEGLGDDDRIATVAVDKRQNGVGRGLGLGHINRKGFGEALSPSSFALVLRNTDCDNGVDAQFFLNLFNGAGYPYGNALEVPKAVLMHYNTGVERFVPFKFPASDFVLGEFAELSASGAALGSAYTNQGPVVLAGPMTDVIIPFGSIQAEFAMSLIAVERDTAFDNSNAVVVTIEVVCPSDNNAVLGSLAIRATDFLSLNMPEMFTITFEQTYWSSQPLSFRVTKALQIPYGVGFKELTLCASTDGSACSYQVPDSCPSQTPTPSPPPTEVCVQNGDCCLYQPCCDGSECVDFGIYKLCVNHACAPTPARPTPAPTYGPVVAYISTSFDLSLDFWMTNENALDWEYLQVVKRFILPKFPGAEFGNVIKRAGSLVAHVPWLNVPYSVLTNPTIIEGMFDHIKNENQGCFHFPGDYLLATDNVIKCKVSFLRLCGDEAGTLVDWRNGVCPTSPPTSEPTEATSLAPTVLATEPPSVSNANKAQQAALAAAGLISRNFNLVIGIVAALVFMLLLLLCFRQWRRQTAINKALKELSTQDDESFIASGGSSMFESSLSPSLEMSQMPSYQSGFQHEISEHSPTTFQDANVPPTFASFSQDSFDNWDDHFKVSREVDQSIVPPPPMGVAPIDRSMSPSSSMSSSSLRTSANDLSVSKMEAVWNVEAAMSKPRTDYI